MKENKGNPIIGIIGGKGNMGSLFAEFFSDRGIEVLISDRKTSLSNKSLASKSDIIIVSVPIEKTIEVIREITPFLKQNSALMDLTSIKAPILKEMLNAKCEVLGMHPMFGNSNPIPGQTIILCKTKKSGHWSGWIEDFFKKNDVKIQHLTPEKHDEIMNVAQGLIHFAEITFVDALRKMKIPVRELFKYTGKASELKVQLAGRLIYQDAGLYGNIQINNPVRLKSLEAFKKSVENLMAIVKKQDLKSFEKYFNANKEYFGSYAKEAFYDSTYLIDRLLEKYKTDELAQKAPKKNSIALLGPMGTFSDTATEKYKKTNPEFIEKYYVSSIDQIFYLVDKGKVKEGIVPIENKGSGTIRETLDALFNSNVQMVEEIKIPIHHCIFTLNKSKAEEIRTILSHPEALNQCKQYIQKNFPKAKIIPYFSTGASIDKLISSRDSTMAAIASESASAKPEIKTLAKNIEDIHDNETIFRVIRKGKKYSKNAGKISAAFYFKKDSPGTLLSVLQDFADHKINLSKIESRPAKVTFGEYIFFVEFDGKLEDKNVKNVLEKIGKKVKKLKILGAF